MREVVDIQDGVDLSHELHSNVKGSLSNHTTKLKVVGDIVVLCTRSSEQTLVCFSLVRGWWLGVGTGGLLKRVPGRDWLVFCV